MMCFSCHILHQPSSDRHDKASDSTRAVLSPSPFIEKSSFASSMASRRGCLFCDTMQSTAIANGTHPQPPHYHTPCHPLLSQLQHHHPFHLDFKNTQLDSASQSTVSFIIGNCSFSCISFLHSSLQYNTPSNTQQLTFHVCLQ